MYACMHEYSHFILVGCFVDAMQLPCGPGAYTLAEKETRKRTIFVYIKNTASSSNIICSSTWHFFLRTSRQKKTKNRGKKTGEAATVVPGIRVTSRTLWTTTNKLEAGPAAKGRDNEGQMRRSHVCFFALVATCDVPGTCPTQKLPLFLNLIQMGPRQNQSRISEVPRPGKYYTNTS